MWTSRKKLRPYQEQDVEILVNDKRKILASETGVGKTITYLRASEKLFEKDDITKMFIFCPAATKFQVRDAIAAETSSSAIVIGGTAKKRQELYRRARKAKIKYVIFGMSITLWTEREQISALIESAKANGGVGVIIDEAYYLKDGPFGQNPAKRVKALFGFSEHFSHRYLVTGTPVQNTPQDAYWLFRYTFGKNGTKKIFGNKEDFDGRYVIYNHYGMPIAGKNLVQFNTLVKPYMIRRTTDEPDVKKYMPELVVENLIVEIDDANFKKAYTILREATISALDLMATYSAQAEHDPEYARKKELALRAAQVRYAYLRMLCVGGTGLISARQKKLEEQGRRSFLHGLVEQNPTLFARPNWGPKIESLADFVKDILRENPKNKFVIFCHFVDALEHIEKVLRKSLKCKIVACKGGDNDQSKKREFNHDPETRIFITSDANKEGVDLPGGSHLIQLDMPHNHAVYWQRVTRIRRTGTKHKIVYGFNALIKGTIEERQLQHIENTKQMAQAMIDGKTHRRDVLDKASAKRGLLFNSTTLNRFLKTDTFGDNAPMKWE